MKKARVFLAGCVTDGAVDKFDKVLLGDSFTVLIAAKKIDELVVVAVATETHQQGVGI